MTSATRPGSLKPQTGDRSRYAGAEPHSLAVAIHDDAVQILDAIGLRLEQAGARLSDAGEAAHVEDLGEEVRAAADRLRSLLLLTTEAAGALCDAIANAAEQIAAQGEFEFELVDRLRGQPAQPHSESLLRIARELLTNVRKHAAARSVKTTLASLQDGVLLRVEDDGIGFRPTRQHTTKARGHAGLKLIEQQVRSAGGRWSISGRPGGGTAVEVWLPPGEA